MEQVTKTIEEIDELIRNGSSKAALTKLTALSATKLSRKQRSVVASLANRVGASAISLRLLSPIVRSKNPSAQPATGEEIAEYGISLIRHGASKEALVLLASLNAEKTPQALLYRSLALFTQWTYAPTIGLLRQYVENPSLTAYQRLVGKVNLLSAYVYEKHFEEARSLAESLLPGVQASKLRLLEGNIFQFLAQAELANGEFEGAEKHLRVAEKILESFHGVDSLFVRKWLAILELRRGGATKSNLKMLSVVRREALDKPHWETVRNCDFIESQVTKNKALFFHVVFGTPYSELRTRWVSAFQEHVNVPQEYSWVLKEGKPISTPDLFSPSTQALKENLKPGGLRFRLLIQLCSDFYQPFRLSQLYQELFPGEYFNPTTSCPRVYQAIDKLRRWFHSERLPLSIVEAKGRYRLTSKSPCALRIPWKLNSLEGTTPLIEALHALKQPFTAVDVAGLLKISRRSALSLLNAAVSDESIIKLGNGNKRVYAVAVSVDGKKAA